MRWLPVMIVAAGVLWGALAGSAFGDLLRVPQDYPTITAACEVAASGDTVGVSAGEYHECADVRSGITVLGMEDDSTLVVVRPSGYSAPFFIRPGGEPVVLENMWIMASESHGVVAANNEALVIQRCYLCCWHEGFTPTLLTAHDHFAVRRCHVLCWSFEETIWMFDMYPYVRAVMEDCVVFTGSEFWGGTDHCRLELRNNTFLSGLHIRSVPQDNTDWTMILVNNIVAGVSCYDSAPDTLELRYNDFVHSLPDPDCGYQIGNFSADPFLCDSTFDGYGVFFLDHRLHPESPCRGSGENGEDVGARWGICWPPEGVDDWPHVERSHFWVSGPSPNPTMGGTRLQLEALPGPRVEIDILDACGRVVRRLPSTRLNGQTHVSWDGRGSDARLVRPGIYHMRLRGPEQTLTRRVAIIR